MNPSRRSSLLASSWLARCRTRDRSYSDQRERVRTNRMRLNFGLPLCASERFSARSASLLTLMSFVVLRATRRALTFRPCAFMWD